MKKKIIIVSLIILLLIALAAGIGYIIFKNAGIQKKLRMKRKKRLKIQWSL